MFEEMSDALHLVPNFDSERAFKVRTGDKKDLVVEINRRRKDLQGRRTIARRLCLLEVGSMHRARLKGGPQAV